LVPKVEAHAAWEHPVRSVSIVVLHEAIGSIAEVHPMVCKAFGLPERVAYTEIDFEKLTSFVSDYKSYKPASKFPTVELDFSFVLPDRTYWSEVEKVALSADTENIVSAQLFDTFVSEELRAAGKKSVAFRVVAQSYDRTFDKDEISAIHEAIVTAIQEKFDATLRA
jgi:phenylalanyl-tRNA synthetase beta chain